VECFLIDIVKGLTVFHEVPVLKLLISFVARKGLGYVYVHIYSNLYLISSSGLFLRL
jgi:hypothetical protein